MLKINNIKKIIKYIMYLLVYYSGILSLVMLANKHIARNHNAIILFYHRFHDHETGKLLPSLSIDEFKKQMCYLKTNFDIISMDDLVHHLQNNAPLIRPSIVLTIDDGYYDNYSLAYPIIRELEVPALIYLTSGMIGTNSVMWLDDVEFALLQTNVRELSFPELFGEVVMDISTKDGKQRALKSFYRSLLPRNNAERNRLVGQLFSILSVNENVKADRARAMLSWEEVKEMASNGVSFGAHTISHPFLPVLSTTDARYEIVESRELIERQIGKDVQHFAIPNGTKKDFTEELRAFCKEAGFSSVVTTESGTVRLGDDLFSLKRFLPPPPMYNFACEVARYIFGERASK